MKKTVLVTGGSSGIGFEMSKYFAANDFDLLWVSLSTDELQAAREMMISLYPDVDIQFLQVDLSNKDGAYQVYEWAKSIGSVDVLINNAGFGTYGYVNEINLDKELAMIHCNVLSVYKLTRYFMSDMVSLDKGTIINISSNSSFHPVPRMNTYASTKAFVRHFSQGLTEEIKLMGSKVKVLTVCPSAIKNTPFKDHEGLSNVKTFSGVAFTTAEEVARDIWNGYQRGQELIVTGRKMRMFYRISHLLPTPLKNYLTKKETELI